MRTAKKFGNIKRKENNMKKTKTQTVPQFKSAKEEATFWDSHSTEDFPEYWKHVDDVTFAKNLTSTYNEVMSIRLDKVTKKAIQKVAKEKGVGTSTAARILLRERLFSL